MADFSLTSVFVVPSGVTIASANSTQDLIPGKVGVFKNDYAVATSGTVAAAPYFYIAQGRTNTYLHATKKSDKISGKNNAGTGSNVTEWYKVPGCATASNQVTDISGFVASCGDTVSLTLRGFSSYVNTLYFNGFTRSVTVQAPCCDCGGDPCTTVDVPALIDAFIVKLEQNIPGTNPDNISFNTFFQFQRIGNDANAVLRISGKPLTKYGQPCDVAVNPYEYDRFWFRSFVYAGPATTADFIVSDACNEIATATITQRASYPKGTAEEILQLEKNFYSYQVGMQKHLFRINGYNPLFESYISAGAVYDTYVIKFNNYDKSAYSFGDYVPIDSTVMVCAVAGSTESTALSAILVAALGAVVGDTTCLTTTSTTTTIWPSVSTTSTLIP